jgi:streptogramin lyase
MQAKVLVAGAALMAAALAGVQGSSSLAAPAEGELAQTGTVGSREEGKMEGVVVNAHREGANFTVSVVSDQDGRYSFPRTHLRPGRHTLTIRAVGYDLVNPGFVEVQATERVNRDLSLEKTRDLASQLSSLEWIQSAPGTAEQKDRLVYQPASCAYCHSLERVMKSKHSAEKLVEVMHRMQTYYYDGTAISRDGRGRAQKGTPQQVESAAKNPMWGGIEPYQAPKAQIAEYLATLNLSGGRATWPYEFKTLPRPKGPETRVIITQYDFPRRDTVAHDLDIDSKGTIWYTDESRMFFGKMNPKSGQFTEYPLPPVPAGHLPGARDVQVDRDDNIWFPRRVANAAVVMTRFNPKTGELSTIEGAGGQYVALGPDGKIWAGWKRIDPKTMKVEATYSWQKSPNLPPGPHWQYIDLTVVNSRGDPYAPDFGGSHIIGIDHTTGEAQFYKVPTPNSAPRRVRMDPQDRLWFAEYTGDRIGMFDTISKQFQEWPARHKYTTAYAVSTPDRNGYVYATSNMSERILRLNPKTGEMIEYQVPTEFDSKKLAHDPTRARPTVWMVNTRTARLMKVEPLD